MKIFGSVSHLLIFLLLMAASCSHNNKFNRETWLANNEVDDTSNLRAYMKDDLLKNYLKMGMIKDSVLALLGKPYQDGIVQRLPNGMKVPDSLSFVNEENMKPENKDKALKRFNEFIKKNSQPDTLLLYPVGWATIDPNFLVVQLDNKGKVSGFWVEQH